MKEVAKKCQKVQKGIFATGVKIERDSCSHTKVNIKSLLTLFSRFKKMKKVGKKSNIFDKYFPQTRLRIEKQSKVSEIAAPTLNPR